MTCGIYHFCHWFPRSLHYIFCTISAGFPEKFWCISYRIARTWLLHYLSYVTVRNKSKRRSAMKRTHCTNNVSRCVWAAAFHKEDQSQAKNENIKRHDSYQKMEQVFSDNTLSCVHFSGSLNITTVQHEALKHCYTHYYSLSEACWFRRHTTYLYSPSLYGLFELTQFRGCLYYTGTTFILEWVSF